MKSLMPLALIFTLFSLVFSACEKDEGLLPKISFATGSDYTSSNATVAGGSSVKIGINASKSEDKDVLKKFDISQSVNGSSSTSIFNQDLTGDDQDSFSYDFTFTVPSNSGDVYELTFTVTNRDGLVNQVSLKLSIQ